jgi:hypothetical protein
VRQLRVIAQAAKARLVISGILSGQRVLVALDFLLQHGQLLVQLVGDQSIIH